MDKVSPAAWLCFWHHLKRELKTEQVLGSICAWLVENTEML